MEGKDPLKPILETCIVLARAETHNGALDWFEVPIIDLPEWVDAVKEINDWQEQKVKKK